MQSKEIQQNAQDIENERLQGYEDVLDEYIGGGTKKSTVSFTIKLDQDSEAIKEFFNSYEIIIEAEEGMTCEEWFNSSYKEKSEQELKSILKNQSEPFYWHWTDDILGDGDEALVLTNGGGYIMNSEAEEQNRYLLRTTDISSCSDWNWTYSS